jgi:hypothetical protein
MAEPDSEKIAGILIPTFAIFPCIFSRLDELAEQGNSGYDTGSSGASDFRIHSKGTVTENPLVCCIDRVGERTHHEENVKTYHFAVCSF